MGEIVRHISGLCGEHFHPNIWHLLLGGVGITTILSYINLYVRCKVKAFAYTLNNTWHNLIK